MKDKTTAALLAFFLGAFGGHKFYLDQSGKGVLYLLFCWTYIPGLIALVEGVQYLTMDDSAFDAKYNDRLPGGMNSRQLPSEFDGQQTQPPQQSQPPRQNQPAPQQDEPSSQMAQNITVNVDGVSDDEPEEEEDDDGDSPELGVAEELERLAELRDSGVISEEEFEKQKEKLIG